MTRVILACLVWLAVFVPASHSAEIFPTNSAWRLFKGRTEASSPDLAAWRPVGFDDAAFTDAPAPFTYGENYTTGTILSDMLNSYSCLFLRRTFELTNVEEIAALRLGAKVDDGFVAWINGVEVQRVNLAAGPVTYTTLAVNATEPVPFVLYDLLAPTNYLLRGTNVIAIQVFNTTTNSSDLVFDCSLDSILVDTNPPAIASVSPTPGTVTSLTRITVTFTEPVSGVNADDLLVNGASASAISGGSATYTFTFPQPLYGGVWISWAPGHLITDFGYPPNPFDATGPGATWFYSLLDLVPPTVGNLFPPASAAVRHLTQIEVAFSEPVAGLEAADLLINGQPATNLITRPGPVHLFQFAPLAAGTVPVAWAQDHGITDLAIPPNPFAGGSWTYLLDPNSPPPDLVINELSAANQTGLTDEDGEQEDWIEIHNRGGNPVDLAGWSLSDNPDLPGQWVCPARTLEPGEFLVVFASGKDRKPSVGTNRWHTNFKLATAGEFLGLYSPDSPRSLVSAFAPQFPEQRNDISYGPDSTGNLRYFDRPTPGTPNGVSAIRGVAADVHFGVTRGHFTQPFTLYLTTPTPGAELRYTVNGSEPTLVNGWRYLSPLRVTNTLLLRAAAFRADLVPSAIGTHSYLFHLPAGHRTLPVISIVTDTNHLTGPTGILGISNVVQQADGTYVPRDATGYHNPSKHGLAWERPTSVEWIAPEDNSGFQVDCGIRVQGSDYQRPRTTTASKFSFRLYFRGDYGPGRLEYPLFPLTSVQSFDQLVLRAGFNEQSSPFIRDELTRRLSHDQGQVASHGTFAVVLLNGAIAPVSPYYNPCERVHEEMLQAHLGGSEEWDVVGPSFAQGAGVPGVIDGDRADFASLVNTVRTQPTTNAATYQEIGRRLDLTNFVDYLLLNVYTAMGDWPQNNWRAGRDRSTTGPWRFIVWDGEWAMGIYSRGVTTNMFANYGPGPNAGGLSSTNDSEIAQMYQRLYLNPEFRLLWADRIHKQMFNGGALMDSNIVVRFTQMQSNLLGVIPSMATDILTTWVPQRRGILFGHFNQVGLLASSNAPFFNQHGGRVTRGFNLAMTATNIGGTIYFTTNGGDPRVRFTGALASNALVYTSPIPLGQSLTVRARTLNGTNWSALAEATFEVATLGVPVRLTELHYNPPLPEGNAAEFLELQNVGTTTLDLGGMSFDGLTFVFTEGTTLAAGARLVLASDAYPTAFSNRYPGVVVAGWFGGALNNGGERITLLDRDGNVVTTVDYDDAAGWPTAPDGSGFSLEVIDPLGDPDDPANWRASTQAGGTPGTAPGAPPPPAVRLNEVMAENLAAVNHGGTFPDWIELHNPGAVEVNLAGWSLTDDGDARKFVFPPNTLVTAGRYLVIWCDAVTNTTPGLHAGFALGRMGDSVFLFDPETNRVEALTFGLQLANLSVSQIGGDWVLSTPTPGAANVAAALGAAADLSLNEWMANPPPGQPDWIELYNRSASLPVALRGLSLATSNAVFQVTSLSFIAPSGFAVLYADEAVGPDHLDFRLPAAGGAITLYDSIAVQVERVTYTAQTEDVSRGRLPDGNANVVNFAGTASPGASNYSTNYAAPVLNEVLARNQSAVTNDGQTADFVEIYNPNPTAWNLGGMSLSVEAAEAGQWIFPPGTVLPALGYLVVWCDGSRPSSTNAGRFNTGRWLDGESGGAYLFHTNSQLVSWVEYGFQVADRSVGLSAGQWRLLATPTPGANNSAPAPLGTNSALRLNEWMANPASGPDWFELHNLSNAPVDLGNLILSDDPSTAGTNQFRVAPLSFIGPWGQVKWVADGDAGAGRNHVNFNLDAQGETLRLYAANGVTLLDSIAFGAQRVGVSEGRLLDGAPTFASFPGSPTPAEPNYLLLPNVVINEVLTHTDPPLEDAVELHNPTDQPAAIGGWFLSPGPNDSRKYRVPDLTVVPARGFAVIYENQFNRGDSNSFTLSAARGGEVWLSEADADGKLTGYRTGASFGPAANGVSFGRHTTRVSLDYVALSGRTFGVDQPATVEQFRAGTGAANAAVLVGPVVMNEIMYHPPLGPGGTDDPEFIELLNVTGVAVPLFDPVHPTNTWRLGGGVEFGFPPGVTLAAGGFLIVVDFDPVADPAALAAFRSRYGVPPAVPVFGPWTGKLDNAGESVRLFKPDPPQPPGAPDAGYVPRVLVDRVDYDNALPWPAGAVDGGGWSLQRRDSLRYGNDPETWLAGLPTAGMANGSGGVVPPNVTQSPASQSLPPAAEARFSVAASGADPLQYQWRFGGFDLAGETNALLVLDYVTLDHEGDYDVVVSNPGGSAFSVPARLQVNAPPVILVPPLTVAVPPGSNALFTVLAVGGAPLGYQWRYEGAEIPGATKPSLLLTNLVLDQSGIYTVVVSNRIATATASAALYVLVRPVVTLQPLSQTTVVGSSATFTIEATGTRPISFRWRKAGATFTNGLIITTPTSSSLTVTNARLTDAATYTAVTTNLAGQALPSQLSSNAVLTVLADTDLDGLPDAWETNYPGFNPNDPADGARDEDGDGLSNAAEWFAGTDYLDAASFLKVELTLSQTALVQFNAVSNRTYTVQYTDGLHPVQWQKLADVLARAATRLETIFDPGTGPTRYYRLVTPMQR